MKFLLTSSGISNPSISDALVDLLGKPVAQSKALVVVSGAYPFPNGAYMAWAAISGKARSPFAELGWEALGVLELTALTSIREDSWIPMLRDAVEDRGNSPLSITEIPQSVPEIRWVRRSVGQLLTVTSPSTSSMMATGNSQCGHSPPIPSLRMNVEHSGQRCSPSDRSPQPSHS